MRVDPPETAIMAMAVLTGIAVGLVMFIEFITKTLR